MSRRTQFVNKPARNLPMLRRRMGTTPTLFSLSVRSNSVGITWGFSATSVITRRSRRRKIWRRSAVGSFCDVPRRSFTLYASGQKAADTTRSVPKRAECFAVLKQLRIRSSIWYANMQSEMYSIAIPWRDNTSYREQIGAPSRVTAVKRLLMTCC